MGDELQKDAKRMPDPELAKGISMPNGNEKWEKNGWGGGGGGEKSENVEPIRIQLKKYVELQTGNRPSRYVELQTGNRAPSRKLIREIKIMTINRKLG